MPTFPRCPFILTCILAFAFCVAAPVFADPVISASVTPQSLPAIGGTVSISASASSNYGIPTLSCELIYANGDTYPIYLDGTGHASWGFSANGSSSAVSYTIQVTAYDQIGTTYHNFVVTIASAKPIILNAVVSPQSLPAESGIFTIGITPQDPNGAGGASYADYVVNGYSYTSSALYDNKTGNSFIANGDAATSTFVLSVNSAPAPVIYTIQVFATDATGTTEQDLTVTVAGAKPIIINATVTLTSLPAIGGTETVNIAPIDSNGASGVSCSYDIYQGNTYVSSYNLYDSKTGNSEIPNGDTATSSFDLPANSSVTTQTYTIKVYAYDATGTTEQDINYTVAGAKPIIINAVVTPTSLQAVGGTVTVGIAPIDSNGASGVSCSYDIYQGSTYISGSTLYDSKTGNSEIPNGDTATNALTLPANTGSTAIIYTLRVYGSDPCLTTEQDINYTVAGFKPITINAAITPQPIPAANGAITIHATATDTNGGSVTNFGFIVFDGNGNVLDNGGFDGTGTGQYNLGVNTGKSPLIYTITIAAYDQAGSTQINIPVTQLDPSSQSDKTLGTSPTGEPMVGEPINVATGNVYDHVTDYETAGANKLALTRYYNSLANPSPVPVMMGLNWRNNFDRYLWLASSTSVAAERADGQVLNFTLTGGMWKSDSDVGVTLTQSGTNWTLTDTDDTVETYAKLSNGTEAILKSLKYRGGYTQNLAYNKSNQLYQVTDSYQRALNLIYKNGVLSTVTTPDGLKTIYGYTASGVTPGGALDRLASVTYTPATGASTKISYLYENASLPLALTAYVNEIGYRHASWTYDQNGRALTSQFGTGAMLTTVAYNDNDGSRTVTNALGQQETYKFTMLQNIPKLTEIDRAATATTGAATKLITYDANGYKASETDWKGTLTRYTNDALGRPTTIVEASGTSLARTTIIAYNGNTHVPTQIIEPMVTSTLMYDSNANVLTKTLTDTTTTTMPYATHGQTRTWTYTWANALLASEQDPRTDVAAKTTYTYDASGALVKTTNALGQSIQVTSHTPGGRPLTIMDANGVTTTYTYDARQRLTGNTVATSTGPLPTQYAYWPDGSLQLVTLPDGSSTGYSYDDAARVVSIGDLGNNSVNYTLDALGNRTQTKFATPSGATQFSHTATFDALGRLLTDTGGAGQLTGYAYDANGNAVTVTDPRHYGWKHSFDALNRQTKATDPTSGVTATAYTPLDKPQTVTASNNGATTYVYDGFGEVIQESSPDRHTTVYDYDADGNLVEKTDATGAVVTMMYDALDRVTEKTYLSDAAEDVSYDYDQTGSGFGIGRLTSVTDAVGTLSRTYDERGNVLSENRNFGAVGLGTAYSYDTAGRLASITYPSGLSVVYLRDALGRVTSVSAMNRGSSSAQSVVSNIGYEPFGPVNSLVFGNGIAETRVFDADYRVTSITDTGTSKLQSLAYGYDPSDDVLSITDGVTSGNSQSLHYDSLGRLVQASGGYGSFTDTYDHMGNRLTQKFGTTSTSYIYTPATNRLASVTSGAMQQTVGYTAAGNINAISSGPISALTYDQAGRLISVGSGTQTVAQYEYDAFGERLIKSLSAGNTLYQYDLQGHLLEETNASGAALVDYIYLDDGRLTGKYTPGTGSLNYVLDDRLGTPQIVTNASKAKIWSAAYQPFGQAAITGTAVQNVRLPGQYADAETGWSQNGFRDYVPSLGRYLESDPIGLGGGLNSYAYADQNPVANVDPSGRNWFSWIWNNGGEYINKGQEGYDKGKEYYELGKNTKNFVDDTTSATSLDNLDTVISDRKNLDSSIIGFLPSWIFHVANKDTLAEAYEQAMYGQQDKDAHSLQKVLDWENGIIGPPPSRQSGNCGSQ